MVYHQHIAQSLAAVSLWGPPLVCKSTQLARLPCFFVQWVELSTCFPAQAQRYAWWVKCCSWNESKPLIPWVTLRKITWPLTVKWECFSQHTEVGPPSLTFCSVVDLWDIPTIPLTFGGDKRHAQMGFLQDIFEDPVSTGFCDALEAEAGRPTMPFHRKGNRLH